MSPPSLRKYFLETIFPARWYGYVLLFLVILKASSYWLISGWQHPDEPLSVIVMYRIGDTDFYPFISGLARFCLGEIVLFEQMGRGLTSFPIIPAFPFALCFRLFGIPGFIIADILIAVCYYIILIVFLKLLGIPKMLAEYASLLVVSEGLNYIISAFQLIYKILPKPFLILRVSFILLCVFLVWRLITKRSTRVPKSGVTPIGVIVTLVLQSTLVGFTGLYLRNWYSVNGLLIWRWRIFRPFITEIVFLLCLCFIAALLHPDLKKIKDTKIQWFWISLGISVSLLIQSDIFSTMVIGPLIAFVVLYIVLINWDAWRDWNYALKNFFSFLLVVTGCSIPFLVQRLAEHPALSKRLGVFPIDRAHPLFLPGNLPYFCVGASFACGLFFIIAFLQGHSGKKGHTLHQPQILLLPFSCFAACIALPILGIVLGKGVQIYHLHERFYSIFSLALFVSFLYMLFYLSDIFGKDHEKDTQKLFQKFGWFYHVLALGMILLSVLATFQMASFYSQKNSHMRIDLAEYASLTNYRSDFVEIVNELLSPTYKDSSVIGTFDQQLFNWWVGLNKKFSFLPSTAFSMVSDDEIETRLLAFCKLLGMNIEDFRTFINRQYVNGNWLALNKYQASKAYTFSPLSDYDPDIQKKIEMTSILDSWYLAIPNGEQNRLIQKFKTMPDNAWKNWRLDLIILTNDESLRNFSPPSDNFELIYENETFRMWKCRLS